MGFVGLDKKSAEGIARGAIGMPRCARHDRILASLGNESRDGIRQFPAAGNFFAQVSAGAPLVRSNEWEDDYERTPMTAFGQPSLIRTGPTSPSE